jgi:hypothetical protein
VGATPSSRDKPNTPFGWAVGVGDEASPAPSATGASQLRASPLRFSTAWFRLVSAFCFSFKYPPASLAPLLLCAFALKNHVTFRRQCPRFFSISAFQFSAFSTKPLVIQRFPSVSIRVHPGLKKRSKKSKKNVDAPPAICDICITHGNNRTTTTH